MVSLGSCCPLWDPALPQHGWVPLESKVWEEGSVSKHSLQEAGGHAWQGAGAAAGMEGLSGKLFWQAALSPFSSPRSGPFTMLRGTPTAV